MTAANTCPRMGGKGSGSDDAVGVDGSEAAGTGAENLMRFPSIRVQACFYDRLDTTEWRTR